MIYTIYVMMSEVRGIMIAVLCGIIHVYRYGSAPCVFTSIFISIHLYLGTIEGTSIVHTELPRRCGMHLYIYRVYQKVCSLIWSTIPESVILSSRVLY